MSWKIEWSRHALAELNKLETKDIQRIIQKLEQVSEDPQTHFQRLKGYDYYKLRVGDYRVIVLLLTTNKVILVENLGHRKNIYK